MKRLTPWSPSWIDGGAEIDEVGRIDADGPRPAREATAVVDDLRLHVKRLRAMGYTAIADNLDEWAALLNVRRRVAR